MRKAELQNEVRRLKARIAKLEDAIYWALGEGDEFKPQPPPLAGKWPLNFWWRTELRRRSNLAVRPFDSATEGTK
jgi:hypothetical protein